MFPITEHKLTFFQIADYWSREIQPPASRDELLALLEGAWWLGEIAHNYPLTRCELLKSMFRSRQIFPTIELVAEEEESPERVKLPGGTVKVEELPDGTVKVDLRPTIIVPGDMDRWNEDSCSIAFEGLAKLPSLEHCPEISPAFRSIELTRAEYIRWLRVRGFDIPAFWGRPIDTTTPLKKASASMIVKAIMDVYDLAESVGTKPPNINELPGLVLDLLKKNGHKTSSRQIQKLGNKPEFNSSRGKVGQTVSRKKKDRAGST